jgi:GH25 family lysozyme M1 (1,4-beta-N-acetylmuramidase)
MESCVVEWKTVKGIDVAAWQLDDDWGVEQTIVQCYQSIGQKWCDGQQHIQTHRSTWWVNEMLTFTSTNIPFMHLAYFL